MYKQGNSDFNHSVETVKKWCSMSDLLQLLEGILGHIPDGLTALKDMISEDFGAGGSIAAIILVVTIAVLIIQSLINIIFKLIRIVILPSVALSFFASFFLSISFSVALPASVSLFVIVLLIKN